MSMVLLLVLPAQGATLDVCLGGGCTYTSVRDAVNAAVATDVIEVAPGSYDETGDSIQFAVDDVTIRGTGGSAATTISLTNADTAFQLNGGVTGIVVEGFTFVPHVNHRVSRLRSNTSARFTDIVVTGSTANRDGSVFYLEGGASLTLQQASITDRSTSLDGSIYLLDGASLTVESSSFARLGAVSGAAIYAQNNDTLVITGSTFDTLTATTAEGGAIRTGTGTAITITGSTFTDTDAATRGGAISVASAPDTAIFDDVDFVRPDAAGDGGALWIDGGTLSWTDVDVLDSDHSDGALFVAGGMNATVTRGSFIGGQASATGGAIRVQANVDLTVIGTSFDDNQTGTTSNGGHIYVNSSSGGSVSVLDIDGASFSNGQASNGGAIYTGPYADVFIDGSTFIDNTAGSGGHLFIEDDGELQVGTTLFSGGTATVGAGGGIRTDPRVPVTLVDVDLQTGTSPTDGGLFYFYAGTLNITGGSFTGGIAGDGGGLYTQSTSTVTLNDVQFTDNQAERGGHVFQNTGGSLTLIDGSYERGTAEIAGGVRAANTSVSITGSTFLDNRAEGSASVVVGGALRVSGTSSTLAVDQAWFEGNSSAARGGAIQIQNFLNGTVRDSTFVDNSADEGGAIAVELQPFRIETTTFEDNTATTGGALWWTSTASQRITLTDNAFVGNGAAEGGAIFGDDGDIDFFDNVLTANLAGEGGAVHLYDPDSVQVRRSLFCANEAAFGDGGGLLVIGPTNGATLIAANLFVENQARFSGGGLGLQNASASVHNNDFLGNTAGAGGGVSSFQTTLNFRNNLVAWQADGSGLHTAHTGTQPNTVVDYNNWTTNTPGDVSGYATVGGNALFLDPQLVDYDGSVLDGDCTLDDYRPTSTSPLLNAGDPSIDNPDGTDNHIGAYGGVHADPDLFADNDADGFTGLYDCDDDDANIKPGAQEICNAVDDDCDGLVDDADPDVDLSSSPDWYLDADGDGYGDASDASPACTQPSGRVADDTDCDDSDGDNFPGNTEVCDGTDNDCDQLIDDGDGDVDLNSAPAWYQDLDGDGTGDINIFVTQCSQPTGHVLSDDDCDDGDAANFPGNTEICDNGDNDCDNVVDDADSDLDLASAPDWFLDGDGDGAGDPTMATASCLAPSGHVAAGDDCDDNDADNFPGNTEDCDGQDNDCDAFVDDDDNNVDLTNGTDFYADLDQDGTGDAGTVTRACVLPAMHVANDTDCDDADAANFPGNTEVCDGQDNDCDNQVDDADGDLDTATTGDWFYDGDGDGFGDAFQAVAACAAPTDHVADGTDCDDNDADNFPGNQEVCSGADNDCDALVDDLDGTVDLSTATDWYDDLDQDGYGAGLARRSCEADIGEAAQDGDCDDTNQLVSPIALEICNSVDDDCDGLVDDDDPGLDTSTGTTFYEDVDGDGYGTPSVSLTACAAPSGYVADNTDCDDLRDTTHPGAVELCDSLDNDCNNAVDDNTGAVDWYADDDGDGYGDDTDSVVACDPQSGRVTQAGDCNDGDATVNEGAAEACNGVDDDCDGQVDNRAGQTWWPDTDGDGYGDADGVVVVSCAAPGGYVGDASDCDDSDGWTHPGADELCDSVDNDCNGTVDDNVVDLTWHLDADGDGYGDPRITTEDCVPPSGYVADGTDCDDQNPGASPAREEIPGNGIDEDCDGKDPEFEPNEPVDWPDTSRGPDETPPDGSTKDPSGCGCATPGAPSGWFALALLAATRRRR